MKINAWNQAVIITFFECCSYEGSELASNKLKVGLTNHPLDTGQIGFCLKAILIAAPFLENCQRDRCF